MKYASPELAKPSSPVTKHGRKYGNVFRNSLSLKTANFEAGFDKAPPRRGLFMW
jgi:hypothetical protein